MDTPGRYGKYLGYWLGALLWAVGGAAHAASTCKIAQIAELRVNRVVNRPMLDGQINGQPVRILLDTGSQRSFISGGAARRLNLPLRVDSNQQFYGIGGAVQEMTAAVEHLKLGSFSADGMRLYVLNTKMGEQPDDPAFVLGADFFWHFTTEYDLAHGVIRLLRPDGCQPEQLVYWDTAYFKAPLDLMTGEDPHIQSYVQVNGRRTNVWLDTGSAISYISQVAATHAGVTPGDDRAKAGNITGLASKPVPMWYGRFDSFSIGNETIRNAKLRIGDIFGGDRKDKLGSHMTHTLDTMPDMILGDDFFLAHRLVVLPREHLMLFTYNGGAVFQVLRPNESAESAEAAAATQTTSADAPALPPATISAPPVAPGPTPAPGSSGGAP
jgi:predicted aspartyl protease